MQKATCVTCTIKCLCDTPDVIYILYLIFDTSSHVLYVYTCNNCVQRNFWHLVKGCVIVLLLDFLQASYLITKNVKWFKKKKMHSLDMTKKHLQKKMSTKLYLLFTVVKDNKKKNVHISTEGCQHLEIFDVKRSLPFSHMNYSGRARDVNRNQTSPC